MDRESYSEVTRGNSRFANFDRCVADGERRDTAHTSPPFNGDRRKPARRDRRKKIKFTEGELSREHRRSCGSIARKACLKKSFHLRANFPCRLALYFYAFFAPRDRRTKFSSSSLRAGPPVLGERSSITRESSQALPLGLTRLLSTSLFLSLILYFITT